MISFSFISLLLTSFCIGTLSLTQCPPNDSIAPCTCELLIGDARSYVRCRGQEVNQSSIDRTLRVMREHNNISPEEFLFINLFDVTETTLTQLDLTPFKKLRSDALKIAANPLLTSIVGPLDNQTARADEFLASIDLFAIYLLNNNLDDEGLGQTFKYLMTDLRQIDLSGNKFSGNVPNSEEDEFFPGLSAFDQLDRLFLSSNSVTRLVGGQFKNLVNLQLLYVDGNRIEEIGPNAFTINSPGSPYQLRIDLSYCDLLDSHFNQSDNGIAGHDRDIVLDLKFNKIDTLSAGSFETFLRAREGNRLIVGDGVQASIFCDSRVKWLKDGRDEFETKVEGALCVNDEGETVFTSTLVN